MKLASSDDFVRGIELFNARRYFESHELLERVWLRSEGNEKAVLQGLIQTAAALLHLERGKLIGARSLLAKSQSNLAGAPDCFMGLELTEFRSGLERFVLDANPHALIFPVLRWSDNKEK